MRTNVLAVGAALTLLAARPDSGAVTFTTNSVIAPTNAAYDGQEVVVNGCTLTVNGAHSFTSLLLTNGAILTHSPAPAGEATNLLNLTILQGASVSADSRIDVASRGYAATAGAGAGASSTKLAGAGGGYGGLGGDSATNLAGGTVYGNVLSPTNFGSGGGNGYFANGGSGGGQVRLTVTGRLHLDGFLLAGGGSVSGLGGAGAGGSVNITAGTLTGYGIISANGGAAVSGGGGGGGRIGIQTTNHAFLGTITAYGGAGAQYGGAGTIYVKPTLAAAGEVRVDNGGQAGQFTPLTTPAPFNLVLANGGIAYPQAPLTNASLSILAGGWVTHLAGQTGLDLTVLGNLVIDAGGRLDVSGKGYTTATGTGAGASSSNGGGGGGSHGGEGGKAAGAGGATYDSIVAPALAGSGGGNGFASTGGSGGGVVRLSVAGKLQVDGALKAEGNPDGNHVFGGGGAGGSLNLTVGGLTGGGVISVNGGSSPNGGGGGAGRIAIYYASNLFSGQLTAYGGAGANRGGAGTIFLKASSSARGQVRVDNGGLAGGWTRLNRAYWPANTTFDLVVGNGAQVLPENALGFGDCLIAAGGLVAHDAGQTNLQLSATNDLRIDAGGLVIADGLGHGPGTGPGAGGNSAHYAGGGAGYGGVGGAGTNGAAGGPAYGSAAQPFHLGSGGGQGYLSTGGAGGGFIRLNAGRILQVNGIVSANGASAGSFYGGGGSGGSIVLVGGIITGSGQITANGGAAKWGGGGAGGRIAMYGGVLVDMPTPPAALGGVSNDGLYVAGKGANGSVYATTNTPPFPSLTALGASAPRLRPVLQAAGMRLEAASVLGTRYQLQTSTDLQTWIDAGDPVTGTGSVLAWTLEATGAPFRFARVLVLEY